MRIVSDHLSLELENQQEIRDLWNIVMFALDFHERCTKEGKPCMTEDEHKLAKDIAKKLDKSWD